MRFRKKPVEVEAMQVKEILRIYNVNFTVLPFWIQESFCKTINRHGNGLIIYTLEGEMVAEENDWLIRGVKGELYPCKPDVFEATYESADIPQMEDYIETFIEDLKGRRKEALDEKTRAREVGNESDGLYNWAVALELNYIISKLEYVMGKRATEPTP